LTDAEWVVLTRELQKTRKTKGLSLEKVQEATRISVAHLTAMEEGRIDAFRKGPFREGHLRAYRAFLGLDSEDGIPTVVAPPAPRTSRKPAVAAKAAPQDPTTSRATAPDTSPDIPVPPPPKPHRVPLRVVRGIALTAVAVLVALTSVWLWKVNPRELALSATEPSASSSGEADQHVNVCAKRNARLKMVVDGEITVDQQVPGGQCFAGDGRNSVEVHLDAMNLWRVTYNGHSMVSLGQQDEPRVLKFIDG